MVPLFDVSSEFGGEAGSMEVEGSEHLYSDLLHFFFKNVNTKMQRNILYYIRQMQHNKYNDIIIGMKMVMFGSCLVFFYHRFWDIIMPLRTADLCLR